MINRRDALWGVMGVVSLILVLVIALDRSTCCSNTGQRCRRRPNASKKHTVKVSSALATAIRSVWGLRVLARSKDAESFGAGDGRVNCGNWTFLVQMESSKYSNRIGDCL